jgi:hypothetical protein
MILVFEEPFLEVHRWYLPTNSKNCPYLTPKSALVKWPTPKEKAVNFNQPVLNLPPLNGKLKVAFDIGGVVSRYPTHMRELMYALKTAGQEIFILTDMNKKDAISAIQHNDLRAWTDSIPLFDDDHILSADWSAHGDLCKTKLMEEHGIHILIDDRPDYVAFGSFIGLVLAPRAVPYYHPTWINKSTPAVMVPPEEMEEFMAWKASKGKT